MDSLDELVSKLDGIDESEIDSLNAFAEENNLVFVYGYGDDCVEFRGAINDEAYCYDVGNLPFTKKGGVTIDDHELFNAINFLKENGYDVECINNQTNTVTVCRNKMWTFETSIPHKKFNLLNAGKLSSIGIVFRMEDVK